MMNIPLQIENESFDQWNHTTLENEEMFEYLNGLWKGKKPPFINAKVLRNTNFNNDGTLSLVDVAELPVEEKQFRTRKLMIGDILLERSGGGPKQPVGRVVYFDLTREDYSFSNFTTCIRVTDKKSLNTKFLLYYLLSFYNQGKTNELQQRTTGIRNLNFADYKKIKIPLPAGQEQESIVLVLSKIHHSIEQQEKIIEKTKELKRSLMHRLFTYGLRGEELKETEIGLMPKSWQIKSISEIADKFLGGGTPPTKIQEYWNGNIHWTTSKRLRDKLYLFDGERLITEKGLNNSSTNLIPKGNLLVSTRVTVGKVAINKTDIAISQDLTGLILSREICNVEFVAYQMQIDRIQQIFNEQKRGATIKGITREDLKKIRLAIPNIAEQREISSIFLTLDSKIFQEESKKQYFQDLFKSMLNNLMTGQVRVKDIDFGGVIYER